MTCKNQRRRESELEKYEAVDGAKGELASYAVEVEVARRRVKEKESVRRTKSLLNPSFLCFI
ncbi:hypothetical protein V6Z11_A11G052700 [Gossypium hirsutum]